MNRDNYKLRERDIRQHWFPTHVAEFSDQGMFKTLEWHKPGTSNYWCRFIISKRTLIVYGDIGDAIYSWSENLTWEWLAGLELSYFAGKCQASEEGRHYEEWDSTEAKTWLEKTFEDDPQAKEKFEDNNGWAEIHTRDEWIQFVAANGYEVFGDDLSSVCECGDVWAMRCQGHLIALQMAVAQLKPAPAQ